MNLLMSVAACNRLNNRGLHKRFFQVLLRTTFVSTVCFWCFLFKTLVRVVKGNVLWFSFHFNPLCKFYFTYWSFSDSFFTWACVCILWRKFGYHEVYDQMQRNSFMCVMVFVVVPVPKNRQLRLCIWPGEGGVSGNHRISEFFGKCPPSKIRIVLEFSSNYSTSYFFPSNFRNLAHTPVEMAVSTWFVGPDQFMHHLWNLFNP